MPLQINLKELKLIPFCMMFMIIVQASIDVSEVEGMQLISYAMLGVVILSFLILGFFETRGRFISMETALISLFLFILIIISLISAADVKDAIYIMVRCVALVMIFDYYKSNSKILVIAAALAFGFCIFYNFINMLQNPSWMVESEKDARGFLLGGNYNQMGGRMICGLLTSALCLMYSKKWLLLVIPISIVCIFSLGAVASMTSLTCVIGFILISLIPSRKIKVIACVGVILAFILFQVLIVFNGNGIENNETVRYFVEDILGKDITFTGRTEKWYAAGKLFEESPLIGYGNVSSEWYLANLAPDAVGPHNFLCALLINGGLVLFTLFCIIIYNSYKPIAKISDQYTITLVLGTAFFFIMQLMEMFPLFFNFYLFILMYFYPDYANVSKEKDNAEQQ